MRKPADRTPRPAKVPRARAPRPAGAARRRTVPARRDTRAEPSLLDRILDMPHLARVVPQLQPEVLHRLIERCGLEDCGEIVALATRGQLAGIFDLDLWRTGAAGTNEQFDADRFGIWLEVLAEAGDDVAAHTLAEMDADLVIAALSQHARVFDHAAGVRTTDPGISSDIGGYRIIAKRTNSWDTIVAVFGALAEMHQVYFHRVMRGVRGLSSSTPEIDGLDNLLTAPEQAMFNLAYDREQRREKQGYTTPAQARAFLQMSRQLPLGHDTAPPGNPVARAYFQAIEWTAAADVEHGANQLSAASSAASPPDDSLDAVAAVVDVLLEAGVLPQQPVALLDGPQGPAPRLARLRSHMQSAAERDPAAYAMRSQELAYVANAILAGCSIQARPCTAQEASDAAVAACNLGLESWPRHWLPANADRGFTTAATGTSLPDDFLVGHDLVSVFQVGWTVLYEQVCMDTAERLIKVLAGLRFEDPEIRSSLNALRVEMTKQSRAGTPWKAREALEVIVMLDTPAWAALLGLIDECPVLHASICALRDSQTRAVSASAFEFISENSQIASIREFMASLPDTLRG
jgi:hypothetical protein